MTAERERMEKQESQGVSKLGTKMKRVCVNAMRHRIRWIAAHGAEKPEQGPTLLPLSARLPSPGRIHDPRSALRVHLVSPHSAAAIFSRIELMLQSADACMHRPDGAEISSEWNGYLQTEAAQRQQLNAHAVLKLQAWSRHPHPWQRRRRVRGEFR